jgi:multidrug transporter EmrE-like cation transporter
VKRRPGPGRRGALRLSIVVPAYNESARLESTLLQLAASLKGWRLPHEIIVVDDGSRDETPLLLHRLAARIRELAVVRLPRNRGKGAAVREGLARARGRYVIFTDADLSTPPSEIKPALAWLERGADMVIGSRALPGSRLPIPQPLPRRLTGRFFNRAVRILLGLPFADTQCGFKGFTLDAARTLARTGTDNGFAFDVELLLLARRHGMTVKEFPITWSDRALSSVRVWAHAPRMFAALLRLQRRFKDVVPYHPARALPLILFSCACAVIGQILFKKGALTLPPVPFGPAFILAMAGAKLIWAGLALFMLSAVTWLQALARVDLSFAFPMLSLNFVFTALYARLYLGEQLAWTRIGGIALVVLGVLVIASTGSAGHHPPVARRPRA